MKSCGWKKRFSLTGGRFPPPQYLGFFLYFWDLAPGYHLTRTLLRPPGNFSHTPSAATAATVFSRHHFLRHPPPISYAVLCKGHLLFTAQNPHLFFFFSSLQNRHLQFWSLSFMLHYFCFPTKFSLWKCEGTVQKPNCMVQGCVSNI